MNTSNFFPCDNYLDDLVVENAYCLVISKVWLVFNKWKKKPKSCSTKMLPGHLICTQCYAQHLCTLCHQQQASALWTSQNTQDRHSEAGRARPPSAGDSQSRVRKEKVMKTLALSFSLAWATTDQRKPNLWPASSPGQLWIGLGWWAWAGLACNTDSVNTEPFVKGWISDYETKSVVLSVTSHETKVATKD